MGHVSSVSWALLEKREWRRDRRDKKRKENKTKKQKTKQTNKQTNKKQKTGAQWQLEWKWNESSVVVENKQTWRTERKLRNYLI